MGPERGGHSPNNKKPIKKKPSKLARATAVAAGTASLMGVPGVVGANARQIEPAVAVGAGEATAQVIKDVFSNSGAVSENGLSHDNLSSQPKSQEERPVTQEFHPQPNQELLESPWMEHLSEAQADQINNFESLNQEQKDSLTLHVFAVRKLAAQGERVNPAAALAQWALEGGWKSLKGYADWGIKQGDWQGPTQIFKKAAEYDPKVGHQVTEPGTFRAYDSLQEASDDYAAFVAKRFPLAASRYQDTNGYIEALQHQPYEKPDGTVGYYQYATGHTPDGHDYSDDLKRMVKSYGLEKLVAIPDEEFTP